MKMARPSQSKQLDEQSDDSNIVVAHKHPPEPAPDNHTISTRPSTRIPETILLNATTPARPTNPRRDQYTTGHLAQGVNNTITPIDHLRIRNAIQREELRTRNRKLRRAHQDSDRFEREANEAREQILHYRNKLRETMVWMEVSVFCALLLLVCVLLYVAWCWVNSAEFELQRRVLRRNLGLE
jgi:hypothetical protein